MSLCAADGSLMAAATAICALHSGNEGAWRCENAIQRQKLNAKAQRHKEKMQIAKFAKKYRERQGGGKRVHGVVDSFQFIVNGL